mmetsp:Transcript_11249/g.32344  ORF Transcript_11249/g.32344 Transcript_11249/m.32344 type:complete len:424 (-) Transcript_11249:228-1499(-)
MTVQDSEAVASQEHGRSKARSALSVGDAAAGVRQRERDELVCATVDVTADQDVSFGRIVLVVGQVARGGSDAVGLGLLPNTSERGDRDVDARNSRLATRVVMKEELASTDVVQFAGGTVGAGGAFALQLEHDHTGIVTGGEQVLVAVRGQDPEPVPLPAEGLHANALGDVPDSDAAILAVGDDQVVLGVEETARDVVGVPTQRVDLPRLRLGHAPQLDLTVIGGRRQQRQGRVEAGPVDSAIVALQDVLDDDVVRAKELGLDVHGRGGGTGMAAHRIDGGRLAHLLLAETGGVPNPDGLIQTGRDDEIFRRVECGAHDVVVVSRQDAEACATLEVPQPQGLIIGRTEDPWELGRVGMELDGADVIQVAQQCEEAASELVIPDLDLVVITSGHDERLLQVEIHTAHGTIVLLETIDDGSDAVIP